MIGTAIGLIFLLIILGVVAWALKQLLALVAPYVGEPFMTIIWVLIVLVMVLIVIWVAMARIWQVGDMWICDWHRICVWGHDWVGLGEKEWPHDPPHSYRHGNADRFRHDGHRCKIGDPNWANDCN